jgi:hypothetical protein
MFLQYFINNLHISFAMIFWVWSHLPKKHLILQYDYKNCESMLIKGEFSIDKSLQLQCKDIDFFLHKQFATYQSWNRHCWTDFLYIIRLDVFPDVELRIDWSLVEYIYIMWRTVICVEVGYSTYYMFVVCNIASRASGMVLLHTFLVSFILLTNILWLCASVLVWETRYFWI